MTLAEMLPVTSLWLEDLEVFNGHCIPFDMVAGQGIHRGTDGWIRASYRITWEPARDVSGIVFPYFHPETGYLVNVRVRRDRHEYDENGKPKNKYIGPSGNTQHLYFLLSHRAKLHQCQIPAVVVEAEKSVLAVAAWADRTGRPMLPVGIGGCWGWHTQRAGNWLAPSGEWQKLPGPIDDLKYLNHRLVYILYDTNVHTNPDVLQARTELIRELNRAERNCTLCVSDLPPNCEG